VRYYSYISDAKLDMLYEQIPPKLLDRIAAELKLDIKVVSVSLKNDPSETTRYGKLNVVENYIERHFDVGTVAEPTPWFRGHLNMRSGIYGDYPHSLLYFSGRQEGVLVALIGSVHHLVGNSAAPPDIPVPYSRLPALFDLLRRSQPGGGSQRTDEDEDKRALSEVVEFAQALPGVREPCEFLARRLLHGPVTGSQPEASRPEAKAILLGTPLYVALAGD